MEVWGLGVGWGTFLYGRLKILVECEQNEELGNRRRKEEKLLTVYLCEDHRTSMNKCS